jgi:hypothetical protein
MCESTTYYQTHLEKGRRRQFLFYTRYEQAPPPIAVAVMRIYILNRCLRPDSCEFTCSSTLANVGPTHWLPAVLLLKVRVALQCSSESHHAEWHKIIGQSSLNDELSF